jgi:RNA polymerase sigma-70 factor (ECF subfamily)
LSSSFCLFGGWWERSDMSRVAQDIEISPEEGLRLHRRLCEGIATAPAELARVFLPFLLVHLRRVNPAVHDHLCQSAAHDALVSLIKHPASFDPARGDLAAYLRMSAQGDLINLLKKEGRHHQGRHPWHLVEHAAENRNDLGRDDDPSLPLRIAEEQELADLNAPDLEGPEWTDEERRVIALMRRGERSTAVFAAALGLSSLPSEEQKREVKKVKDRIKKRQQRREVL